MATFTPAVKSVCLETRPLVLLLILMNVISDGTCQSISLPCSNPQDGSETPFKCSVETSICKHSFVFFDFENKTGTPSALCRVSANSTCGQPPTGGMNCGCVLSQSGFRYYQLNFLGDKATYNEGTLTCSLNCEAGEASASCQPLTFASTSTSPSTTTVESAVTTSQSPSAATSNSSSTETGGKAEDTTSSPVTNTGLIVGLAVGLTAGLLLCAFLGFIIYKKFIKR